ncbi:hypothetical protein [Arcobacter sp. LA11]|uniref:hypothetical protein n=1 Tax=Arcobacter sp. LA11 TaxID=1898176 RepID=UPI00093326EC|nr:hypothetical protein [Arcobacter sp. LA11]
MNSNSISKVSNIISEDVNSSFTKDEDSLSEVDYAIDEIERILSQERIRQSQTEEQIKYEKEKKKSLHNQIDFITKRDRSNLIKSFLLKQIEPDNEIFHLEEYLENINDNIKKLVGFLDVLLAKKSIIELEVNSYSKVSFFNLNHYKF